MVLLLLFPFTQLWDLNELLQDSADGEKNDSAAEDSDTDGMDVDDNAPKSSKGIYNISHS